LLLSLCSSTKFPPTNQVTVGSGRPEVKQNQWFNSELKTKYIVPEEKENRKIYNLFEKTSRMFNLVNPHYAFSNKKKTQ